MDRVLSKLDEEETTIVSPVDAFVNGKYSILKPYI
jgi:hypothetical protein